MIFLEFFPCVFHQLFKRENPKQVQTKLPANIKTNISENTESRLYGAACRALKILYIPSYDSLGFYDTPGFMTPLVFMRPPAFMTPTVFMTPRVFMTPPLL